MLLTKTQINNLPSVSISEVSTLPKVGAVYFVCRPTGEIIYVGKSSNLRLRWKQEHHIKPLIINESDISIKWIDCDHMTDDECCELEIQYISSFNPKFNKSKAKVGGKPKHKLPTSVRLSPKCKELIWKLSDKMGISQAAILEISVRDLAEKEGVKSRVVATEVIVDVL